MTVADLIRALGLCNPTDKVVAFNADSGKDEEVSGITYAGNDHEVTIYTDDIS